jgi:hypothetical protein
MIVGERKTLVDCRLEGAGRGRSLCSCNMQDFHKGDWVGNK